MKIKINKFPGIYSNFNEVISNSEYAKILSATPSKTQLEAKGYKVSPIKSLSVIPTNASNTITNTSSFPIATSNSGDSIEGDADNLLSSNYNNILWFSEIALDNDKYGVSRIRGESLGEYVSNYIFDYEYFFAIIYIADDNYTYIDIINSNDFSIRKKYWLSGEFRKAINEKGILYITTSTQSYQLQKIDRTTNRLVGQSYFYSENGIYLNPIIPSTDIDATTFTLEKTSIQLDGETVNVTFSNYEEKLADRRLQYVFGKYIYKFKKYIYSNIKNISTDETYITLRYTTIYDIKVAIEANRDTVTVYFGEDDGDFSSDAKTYSMKTVLAGETYEDPFDAAIEFAKLFLAESKNLTTALYSSTIFENTNSDIVVDGIDYVTKDGTHLSYQEILDRTMNTYESNIAKEIDENNTFPTGTNQTYWFYSYLLDDGSEIVMDSKFEIQLSSSLYYGYNIKDLVFPTELSTRIMSFRLYIKNKLLDPYQLVFEHSFYVNDANNQSRFLTGLSLSGIYSLQTIGTNDPIKNKSFYTPIRIFEDFIFSNGLMIIVSGTNVLYPIIANGKLTKIYYPINVIPEVEGNNLMSINGILGVRKNDRISLVNITSEDGLLIFNIKDEMGLVTKDVYDIVETPDGVILHTNAGIYATDGQNLSLLSEPINDKVIKGFNYSNIFHDVLARTLWYINDLEKTVFIYSFDNNSWYSPIEYDKYLSMFVANDNTKYLSTANQIYAIEEQPKESILVSNMTNLGDSDLLKKILYIDFDFIGEITWNNPFIDADKRKIDSYYRTSTGAISYIERMTKRIYVPLSGRRLGNYHSWIFELSAGTILYNYEVTFETEEKR